MWGLYWTHLTCRRWVPETGYKMKKQESFYKQTIYSIALKISVNFKTACKQDERGYDPQNYIYIYMLSGAVSS